MKNRIASVVSLSLLFSTLLVSCSKSSGTSNNAPPKPNTVSIVNMTFTPATITVAAGTTVTWQNSDNTTHTVTANDETYDSGNIGSGSSFSKTFSTAGTYPYHCSIHPSMTGQVVVN